jgi:hypothetical protein
MKNDKTIKDKVLEWQEKFPLDFWWRKKHGVAFMSPEHKSTSFLDQLFEYEEDRMIEEIKEEIQNPYIPNSGDIWKETKENEISEEEMVQNASSEFEKIQKEFGIDG